MEPIILSGETPSSSITPTILGDPVCPGAAEQGGDFWGPEQ